MAENKVENKRFVQVHGPFKTNEDIIAKIKEFINNNGNNSSSGFSHIKRIGIQSIPTHKCKINNISFEIGQTKILEFNNVSVTSLSFSQDEPASTLIDCILGGGEE